MDQKDNILKLEKNTVTPETYFKMRNAVHWKALSKTQAEKALANSLCTFCVTLAGQPIGMARLVGDGAVICYVQDLIIHPNAQGMGVGTMLLEAVIREVEDLTEPGTEMMLDLMCAKGREGFYERFGFVARPTDTLGPGMIQYVRKSQER